MLSRDEIVRKYGGNGQAPELHANEIVLLAYYIASVNIETAFQGATGADYQPFDGICLTDTFAMGQGDDLIAAIFPHNSRRRDRQNKLDIRVIVGNPPWSAGQSAALRTRTPTSPIRRLRHVSPRPMPSDQQQPTRTASTTPTRWPSAGLPTGSATTASSPSSPTDPGSTVASIPGSALALPRNSAPSTS